MSLSLASPPNRILARLDVQTTLSKKFNDGTRGRCRKPGGISPVAWALDRPAIRAGALQRASTLVVLAVPAVIAVIFVSATNALPCAFDLRPPNIQPARNHVWPCFGS
jgi:hypothetical protein